MSTSLPKQSIPEYVDSLNIEQLENLIRTAETKLRVAKEGKRVKIWYVKGACNYYHTDDPLRARAYMAICLENFPDPDDYLEISYGFVYRSEVEEYISVYEKENREIDEYLAAKENDAGNL